MMFCWDQSCTVTRALVAAMLQVTPEQSLALVEYIAHLSVEDWDHVAEDLRKLGFIPPGAFLVESRVRSMHAAVCADKDW